MSNEFFEAITRGDAATVRNLIEAHPGLVDARKENGESAILLALYHRRREIAEIILAKGPELNIFEASAAGKLELVRALAQAEPASVNGYSYDGWTPLHLAAFFGHREVAEFLLAHGANVIAVAKNSNANTPLHAAVAGGHLEIAKLLLARGANINARQAGGYTALHSAASGRSAELVKLLLSNGADVNPRSDDGRTALAFASQKGHEDIAELLRQHGGSE